MFQACIGKVVRKRRKELHLTQDQVVAASDISKPYLSNIETGRMKNPPTDTVLKALEKTLGFEAAYLTRLADWARTPVEIRKNQEMLTKRLEQLQIAMGRLTGRAPDDIARTTDTASSGEDLAMKLTQGMDPSDRNVRMLQATRAVPIINKMAAGGPKTFTDLDYPTSVADEYISCPDVRDANAFAARVSGDSMEPVYHQDDIVIFSPNTEARNGDDCFVRFDGDCASTFKRFYQDSPDSIRLQPLNNTYPAQIINRERITGLWPALFRVEKLRR